MFAFGDYNTTDLLWMGDWGTLWLGLLAILAGAALLFSIYDLRDLRPHRRAVLIGLRAFVIALALALLLEPAVDLRQTSPVANHVAVVVDTSMTMDLTVEGDESRFDRARAAIQEVRDLQERYGHEHQFDFFQYGDEFRPTDANALMGLDPQGTDANLTDALTRIEDHYRGKDLAGIVLLSDGIDTGELGQRFQRIEDEAPPLDEASQEIVQRLGVPIHTLAVTGDRGLRDIAIHDVGHDDFAFVHNRVTVDVHIRAHGMEPKRVPVELRRDGVTISTKDIQIHPGESDYHLEFEFVPEEIGKEVYTAHLPEYEDEALYENNDYHFVIPVIRDRIRVLQVVGRPSWDQRFLRRLLKRNPNIELISFFILRTDENPNLVPQDEMSLIRFPTNELFDDELGSFDLVLFQNFNFGPYRMGQYLSNIADFVQDGGGFAMIGGDLSFASGGYHRTPIESILPVRLPSSRNRQALMNDEHFRPQLTEAGNRHPITQLAFEPSQNRQIWEDLPPLRGANMVEGATDDATVLAHHPTRSHGGEPVPVISVAERGEGRVMALTSDSSWRWGFEHIGEGGTAREYQNFWNRAMRWLIQDPDLKLLRLDMNRDIVSPGESLDASVRAYTSDYRPRDDASGTLRIEFTPLDQLGEPRDDADLREERTISFRTDHEGLWNLEEAFDTPGLYDLRAEIPTDAGTLSDDNRVLVTPDVDQYRNIVPRHRLLEGIADATDAYHAVLPDWQPRSLHFHEPHHRQVHDRRVVQLWDSLWVFLVIVGLLAIEWTLRRRWGRL